MFYIFFIIIQGVVVALQIEIDRLSKLIWKLTY